ncbi:MAG: hypothetical protein ACFCBU_06960, partial [Cyanophyceae cyanobacterium]
MLSPAIGADPPQFSDSQIYNSRSVTAIAPFPWISTATWLQTVETAVNGALAPQAAKIGSAT